MSDRPWLVIVPVLVGVEAGTEEEARSKADRLIDAHWLNPYTGTGEHVADVMEAEEGTPIDPLPVRCELHVPTGAWR